VLDQFTTPSARRESFRDALIWLAVFGLIIRIGFFCEHRHAPSFGVPVLDEKYYDHAARLILSGADLHQLHGFKPLCYPLLLAGIYTVGGEHGIELTLLVQHLLGVATAVFIALLGARLFHNGAAGICGGALYLLAPLPLAFEGQLVVESSYVFVIVVALWLHLRAVAAQSWPRWLLAGAAIALAAQLRSNILIFLAVYPLFAAWIFWRARTRAAWLPLVGLVGVFVMLFAWAGVNARQSDRFQLLSNAGGVNFFLGNQRTADGLTARQPRRVAYGEDYADPMEVWAAEEYATQMRAAGREPSAEPQEISRYWTHRALDEIKADPVRWLKLLARKTWLSFWNTEVPNNKSFAFLQDEFAWLRWLPVSWAMLLVLAPAGVWLARKPDARAALLLLFAYAALYTAGNVAFFISDRYRYPIWPVLAMFAGGGAVVTFEMMRAKNWRAFAAMLASAGAMLAVSLPNWGHAQLPSFARDYLFRAIAASENGNYSAALTDINRSLALDDSDVTAHHQRANILFAVKNFAAARTEYEITLRLEPGEAGAWNNLGATLEALGQPAAALAAYTRSTACAPPSRNGFLSLVALQLRAGKLADATTTLDQFEKNFPASDADALALRAWLEQKLGHAPLAFTLEQKSRALDATAFDRVSQRVNPTNSTP
jgi:Tfp pilus assembly protein PilF